MPIRHRTITCSGCGRIFRGDWTNRIYKNNSTVKDCSHCFRLFSDNEVDILVKKYL